MQDAAVSYRYFYICVSLFDMKPGAATNSMTDQMETVLGDPLGG